MSLLPSENHTSIIQTFSEKEPEPCEIKMNLTKAKKDCKYISSKKETHSKEIVTRQAYKI